MTDELNLEDLDTIEKEITNKNAVEERVRNSITAKKEAEAKAEAADKARVEAEAKLATMEKETKFLNSFTDVTAKFPTASEFKDKIKEKVMSGYSVDDAAISILVAEGRYTPPVQPVQKENVAGGSAPNQIVQTPNKSVQEMTSAERWAALGEAERRGDIGLQ